MSDDVAEPKPKTSKTTKYVKARAIKTTAKSVLLEWTDDRLRRGFVPTEAYDHDKERASESALKAAIPYGVDWAKAAVEVDSVALDQELKKRGIWTLEELNQNPNLVNTIIMRLAGVSRAALVKFAKGDK